MDRFIVDALKKRLNLVYSLKSNMDRFIDPTFKMYLSYDDV